MLDPLVTGALIILVAQGLKVVATYFNFPIDEATLNTLAAAIVTWLLAQFVRARLQAAAKGTRFSGLLSEKE